MILQELVLTDFGAFSGKQTLPLAPREERPVVLIGALNGTGKTTVLEALQLVLFGALAPHGSRRGLSYDAYLLQTVNDQQDPAVGASIELAFAAHFEGTLQQLRLLRRWWHLPSGRFKEEVTVHVGDEFDQVLSENWTEYVEAFVPRGVAGLFFFDGEQIEGFADLEASKALLQTAISGLLGLDIVDRLVGDLEILERRKRVSGIQDSDAIKHLEQLNQAVDRLRAAETDAQLRADNARARLSRAKQDEREAEKAYELEGGAQHERRAQLETAHADANARLAVAEARLLDASTDAAPLLLIADLVKRTHQQVEAEVRAELDAKMQELLAERDAGLSTLLRRLERQGAASKETRDQVQQFLKADRDGRAPQEGGMRLQASGEAAAALSNLANGGLDEQASLLTQYKREFEKAVIARDRSERALASIPTADTLEELLIARERVRAEVLHAGHAVEAAVQDFASERNARERAEKNRERIELEAARESLLAEDTTRLLAHADRARTTLRRLREEATRRHAAQIRAHVLDALRILLRKQHLVVDLDIDPVTYQLTLLDRNGAEVAPTKLSAGERQMVAVSMLWGLAKAAGRPLPVVIDTPLGRLDGIHRSRFVESYLPHASHQVIVLSTDTEIDDEALALLGDSVSHTVHLIHDPDTGSSRVEEGYVVTKGKRR